MEKRYTKNERELIYEIGLFFFNQQLIFNRLQFQISAIISRSGKADNERGSKELFKISQILQSGLTDYPLLEKYKAILLLKNGDKNINELFEKIRKILISFIELRNKLAHGKMEQVIDWELLDYADPDKFSLSHPKIKANGFDEGRKEFILAEFKCVNKIGELLIDCVHAMILFLHNPKDNQNYPLSIKQVESILREVEKLIPKQNLLP